MFGRAIGAVVDRVLAGPSGKSAAQAGADLEAQAAAKKVISEVVNPANRKSARQQLRELSDISSSMLTQRTPEEIEKAAIDQAVAKSSFKAASLLFVPCHNSKALAKIQNIEADAFILDLEDAVPPAKKEAARDNLYSMCQAGAFANKRVYVRINSPRDAPHLGFHDLDTCGILNKQIAGVCLPKTEVGDYEVITQATHPDLAYWAFIETAKGIAQVEAIAGSGHFRALVLGTNDLSSDLGLPSRDFYDAAAREGCFIPPRFALQHAMSRVILAAKQHDLPVFDGVFNDFNDATGFHRDCVLGKAMGFDGKTLIHPNQVGQCNKIFDPTPAECQWARKVIAAVAKADGGATVCEGRMVEEMHASQAGATLARAALAAARTKAAPAAACSSPQAAKQSEKEMEEAAAKILEKEYEELHGPAEEIMPQVTLSDLERIRKSGGKASIKPTAPSGGRTAPSRKGRAADDGEKSELLFDPTDVDTMPAAASAPAEGSRSDDQPLNTADGSLDEIRAESEELRRSAREARRSNRQAPPTRMIQPDYRKVKDDEVCDPVSEKQVIRWR